MCHRLLAVLATLLALGLPALGGEEEAFSPYANGTWDRAQAQAAKAHLVIVGKVVEAGKPEGAPWSQNKPENYDQATMTALIDLKQGLTVEVKEVLHGELKASKLVVKTGQVAVPLMVAHQMMQQPQAKDPRQRFRREIPVAEFALAKGAVYLLFLSEPKTGKGKDGKESVTAEHVAKAMPMAAPDEQLMKSVRAFCQALADWKQPPRLSAEEEARVKALVADLGADDFEKRDKAEAELKSLGPRTKPYVQPAAKDKDPERSFRAREILKAIEPAPGAVEIPQSGRSEAAKPSVMKEKPKPKPPEDEPGPEGQPAPPAPDR
jgi:hypothetical protein